MYKCINIQIHTNTYKYIQIHTNTYKYIIHRNFLGHEHLLMTKWNTINFLYSQLVLRPLLKP